MFPPDVRTVSRGSSWYRAGHLALGVCHDPHPVATSWYVEVESDRGRVRVVACEDCASAARRFTST